MGVTLAPFKDTINDIKLILKEMREHRKVHSHLFKHRREFHSKNMQYLCEFEGTPRVIPGKITCHKKG